MLIQWALLFVWVDAESRVIVAILLISKWIGALSNVLKVESCVTMRGKALRRGVATLLSPHSQRMSDNAIAITHMGSIAKTAVLKLRFLFRVISVEDEMINVVLRA